jgi:hypothetical protein
MRNYTLKKAALALFIATLGFCIPSQAQTATEELILQSPGVHAERNLDEIIRELEALNGITYVGFCTNQNVILLRIDRRKHSDDRYILAAFTSRLLEVHIKTGASIEQVISACPNTILSSTVPAPDPGGSGSPE